MQFLAPALLTKNMVDSAVGNYFIKIAKLDCFLVKTEFGCLFPLQISRLVGRGKFTICNTQKRMDHLVEINMFLLCGFGLFQKSLKFQSR